MALSNVILTNYTTSGLLSAPRTDNVLATTADIHVTSLVDTGSTYWAVFSDSSGRTAADIITPVDAVDSGNAAAQLTEDTFNVTGLDTENVSYYVWFANTDSVNALRGVSFGVDIGGDINIISPVISGVIGQVIGSVISSAVAVVGILSVDPEFSFDIAANSQYLQFL